MEVFTLQIITIRKKSLIRYASFLLILFLGFGTVMVSRGIKPETTEIKLYFVDEQMMRLIPVSTTIPKTTTDRMAQHVLDEIMEGRDDNPKIRRLLPYKKHGLTFKVEDNIAYVNIDKYIAENHPDGRDIEMLTVYSIVNSLAEIDGIINVRFTIDGESQKDFMGYLDMRETFIPDYYV